MSNKIKIEIIGKNTDYFLKEIIRKNIDIYNLEKENHKLVITVNYSDYLKIKDSKTTYKINIISRYGLNRIQHLINKYLLLIIFFLIGILINLFLSNIIFSIKVIHPNRNIRNIIIKDLKLYGLSKYHFKPTYKQREKIKRKILAKEKDKIEWLEIEENGTKYIIRVEERKIKKEESLCPERHIVARKNALILEISASAGEIVKKKNDYVNKGDVLISGLIHNKETIVSKKCAQGIIFGEVWYKVKIALPKYYLKETKIRGKKYGLTLKVFTKEYNYQKKLRNYNIQEYNIIKDDIVPIKLTFNTYQRVKKTKYKKNIECIKKEAINIATKRLNEKLKNDEKILDKKVLKIVENNSKIDVEVFFRIKEDITDYQEITDLNIEEINKMNKKEE